MKITSQWIKDWQSHVPEENRDVLLTTPSGQEYTFPIVVENAVLLFCETDIPNETEYIKMIEPCLFVGKKFIWVVKCVEPPMDEEEEYGEYIWKGYKTVLRLWSEIWPHTGLLIIHRPATKHLPEALWYLTSFEITDKRNKTAKVKTICLDTFDTIFSDITANHPNGRQIVITPNALGRLGIKFKYNCINPEKSYYITHIPVNELNQDLYFYLDYPLFVKGSIVARTIYSQSGIVATGDISAETTWFKDDNKPHGNIDNGTLSVNGSIYAKKSIRAGEITVSGDIRAKEKLTANYIFTNGRIEAKTTSAKEICMSQDTNQKEFEWLPIDALRRKSSEK